MRKKKAVKSIQQYRKRRYIPRTPKVLKKYQESNWSKMLQLGRCQDPSSKDGELFRRRFRIPYPLFLEIVEVVRNKNWFPEVDCTGAPSAPLELKILGVLRVLGRGMCFERIEELTNIDEETVKGFFHVFCERFAVEFFPVYCCPPETKEDIERKMNVYERLGLPGCIGSTDCVHIR